MDFTGSRVYPAVQAHNPAHAGPRVQIPPPQPNAMKLYRVYVLENPKRRFYTGISEDAEARNCQHNAGVSRWTRGKGPWEIVWQSERLSLSDARKLENVLKRQKAGDGFYRLTGLPRHSGS
jgi:putative endonuclease